MTEKDIKFLQLLAEEIKFHGYNAQAERLIQIVEKDSKPFEEYAKQLNGQVRRMEMIAQDMADDAKNFDGKPFNGRTVAEYFGNHGAAIAALADTIKLLIKESA